MALFPAINLVHSRGVRYCSGHQSCTIAFSLLDQTTSKMQRVQDILVECPSAVGGKYPVLNVDFVCEAGGRPWHFARMIPAELAATISLAQPGGELVSAIAAESRLGLGQGRGATLSNTSTGMQALNPLFLGLLLLLLLS